MNRQIGGFLGALFASAFSIVFVVSTASAQVASALLNEDQLLPALGAGTQVNGIDYPRINSVGGWAIRCTTNNGPTNPDIIFGAPDGMTVPDILRMEGTFSGWPQTSINGTGLGIDDAGQILYRAVVTGSDNILFIDDNVFIQEGTVIVGGPLDGFTWVNLLDAILTRDGTPWYPPEIDTGGTTAADTEHVARGNYELLRSTGDLVPNFPAILDGDASVFDTLVVSPNGCSYLVVGEIETTGTGVTSSEDHALIMDGIGLTVGGVLIQEGHAVPNGLGGELFGSTLVDMHVVNDFGDWAINSDTSAATTMDEILMINGQIVGREGNPVNGGPDAYGGTLDALSINNQGDWAALWTINGTTVDAVILNGEVLLVEGDQVDSNNDGMLNDGAVLSATVGVFDEGIAITDRDAAGDVGVYMIVDVNTGTVLEGVYHMVVNTGAPSAQELEIRVTDSPDPLTSTPGQICYDIRVRNNSPTMSTGVTVTSELDAGQTFNAGLSDPIAMDVGGDVVANIGDMDPYEIFKYKVVVDVTTSGTKNVTSTVAANEADPVAGNNSTVTSTDVIAITDLSVSITDSPDPLNVLNGNVTYTVTVTNDGPSDATDVEATLTLDGTTNFVSTDPVAMHDGMFPGGVVTADITGPNGSNGPLLSGNSIMFNVVVQVTTEATLNAQANVAGNEFDRDLGNNDDAEATVYALVSNLSITISDDTDPVSPGEQITYTVTVANAGPTDATGVVADVMLDPNTVLVSVDPPGAPNGPDVQANVGNLLSGNNVAFGIVVDVGSQRYMKASGLVAGNETDPSTTNNATDEVTASYIHAVGLPKVVFSDVVSDASSDIPGLGGVKFTAFKRPWRSPNGENWILVGETDQNNDTRDDALVSGDSDGSRFFDDVIIRSVNGVIETVTQQGVDLDDLGVAYGPFDMHLTINDDGDYAFATNPRNLAIDGTSTELIVKNVGGVYTTVAREDDVNMLLFQLYNFDMRSPLIQSDGTIWFDALLGADVNTITGRVYLSDDGTVLETRDGHVPQNQTVNPGAAWDDTNQRYGFHTDGAGATYILSGQTTSPFNGVFATGVAGNPPATATSAVIEEGAPVGGLPDNVTGVGSYAVSESRMTGSGDWYATGQNVGNNDWLVRNGVVLAYSTDPIHTGAGESWSTRTSSINFFVYAADNGGDYATAGFTDCLDTTSDVALVYNNERIVLRENDPVDLNGNGLLDDGLFVNTFGENDMFLDEDGRLYFVITMRDSNGAAAGDAFVVMNVLCAGIYGDLNLDNGVDGEDLQDFTDCVLAGNPPAPDCVCADVNGDGMVDFNDVGPYADLLVELP